MPTALSGFACTASHGGRANRVDGFRAIQSSAGFAWP